MPKNVSVVGHRKSQLTRTTRLPACANEAARLAATVDLPSAGAALVISRVLMLCSKLMKSNEFLRTRYASAAGDPGFSIIVSFRYSSFSNFSRGISPRTGAPRAPSTSSVDLSVLSRYSLRSANPIPRTRPRDNPSNALRSGFGETG